MNQRINRNISFRALEGLVVIGCSLGQYALITRALTQEEVGRYALLLACMFFVSALSCVFGMMGIMTREITQEREPSCVVSSGAMAQLFLSCVLAAICIPLILTVNYFASIRDGLLVVAVAFLLTTAPLVFKAILSARQEMGKISLINMTAQGVSLAAVALCVVAQLELYYFYLAFLSLHLTQVALTLLSSGWKPLFSLRAFAFKEAWYLFKEAIPIVIMIVVAHLYVRTDVFMIDFMVGKEAVAQYTAAYNFLDYLMILSNTIMAAVFPNFTGLASTDSDQFKILYRRMIRLFMCWLVPIAVAIALFSQEVLSVVYGAQYAPASSALVLLMIAAVFAWINGPSGTIFIALKKQQVYVYASLFSLVVNVVGNLFLIPLLGYTGAAVATVLTEIAICLFCLLQLYRLIGYVPLFCRLESNSL